MAWLTSLLKKPEPQDAPPIEAELTPEGPRTPDLAVLVPDMAGISSFRLRKLPSAASGIEHIASLRADVRHETHAFWALHDKPIVDESTRVEALVLIRAQTDSDLVYVVSFLDIESALSFTRFEVRRGLYLGNVMIYWAAFAQLREELDGVSITPEFAPPTENYVLPVHRQVEIHAPEPVASLAVAEPEVELEPVAEPAAETPVETEALQAVEDYLRKSAGRPKRRVTEPVVEPVAAMEPPVIEEQPIAEPVAEPTFVDDSQNLGPLWPETNARVVAAEPEAELTSPVAEEQAAIMEPPVIEEQPVAEAAAIADPVFEDDAADLGPMWPETNARVEAAQPEADPALSSPVAEEQAAIEEAFVFQHKTVEFRPLAKPTALEVLGEANGLLVDGEPEPIARFGADHHVAEAPTARLGIGEPEPGIETIAGDEEADFLPLGSADPAASLVATPGLDDFDVAYEVERLLRGRKWEQREGPFSGFQSPPGRF
jgi:hypothetical protein